MAAPLSGRIQVFDPQQETSVVLRRLPHWSQAGTVAFVTWRTWDSMPAAVIEQWLAERDAWLHRHGLYRPLAPRDARTSRGARRLQSRDLTKSLGPAKANEFQRIFADRWNSSLDACHGECALRRPELSLLVTESLHYADETDYVLTDYVVMPNHVHVLAAFADDQLMLKTCDSWKHFSSVQINRALSRRGRFWQQDGFDHLVRTPEQFARLRDYIAENPSRAGLQIGEYRHYSKLL